MERVAHISRVLEDEQRLLRTAENYVWPEGEDVTCSIATFSATDIVAAMDRQDEWFNLPNPSNWDEAMSRVDSALFMGALVTEVGAFERLKVLSFGYTRDELASSQTTSIS
eukprot:COSAG01_NODE_8180_length_2888_cov_1.756185_3_plen_111_part_00